MPSVTGLHLLSCDEYAALGHRKHSMSASCRSGVIASWKTCSSRAGVGSSAREAGADIRSSCCICLPGDMCTCISKRLSPRVQNVTAIDMARPSHVDRTYVALKVIDQVRHAGSILSASGRVGRWDREPIQDLSLALVWDQTALPRAIRRNRHVSPSQLLGSVRRWTRVRPPGSDCFDIDSECLRCVAENPCRGSREVALRIVAQSLIYKTQELSFINVQMKLPFGGQARLLEGFLVLKMTHGANCLDGTCAMLEVLRV